MRDRSHFSYSTLAEAAAQRRDNLRQSVQVLREKLAAAVIGYERILGPGSGCQKGGHQTAAGHRRGKIRRLPLRHGGHSQKAAA